ncbi:MAG: mechanosensitive ion channel family protein [Candidatus Omnitrophica bacterium]|nr:mechanosensitive ion channel family protein [Candidatus Omnitrophota bacterium]MDD5671117.1 mechanosensitive ion channel family protein [Candidatus Omnitrophota bacterium]
MFSQQVKWEDILNTVWFGKSVKTLVIFLICWLLFLFLKHGLRKFEEMVSEKEVIRESEMTLRLKTYSHILKWLGSILIFAVTLYMLLQNFGIDVAPLLAGAGIVGLAFGFGGQYLIRDIINGVFILFEGQYRVNDVVQIGEHGGLVEAVNLRITKLRDLEGRVIYIPNGEIKTVVNFTKEYAQALLNVGVAYKENIDRAMSVIKELGGEMRKDPYYGKLILDNLEMLGVDEFGESQVTIKFRMKTLPIKQWEVAREFRRRLKNRFDELGIEIPFPHRTLYWGAPGEKASGREVGFKNTGEKSGSIPGRQA